MTENAVQGWLPSDYDYKAPKRGQIRQGTVLTVDKDGLMVDIGLKRDGFVPIWDVERVEDVDASGIQPGDEVVTRIVKPMRDQECIQVSMYQAQSEKDWDRATEMMESGEIWMGEVTGHNRGGVTADLGHVRGFIPASHLWERLPRGASSEDRDEQLRSQVSKEIPLKVIEVDRNRNRLILSERLARQEMRERNMEQLLEELREGDVRHGHVRAIKPFGAFVDIGGADGLVHISELAWRRIHHPKEVLEVGDEIDVQVLSIDRERNRIGLSLKRIKPNPWELVDMLYYEGQIVKGRVTNVVDFGAFVAIDAGIEGLVHISELADPEPAHPQDLVEKGQELVLRVIRIESHRERMALSLKRMDPDEREAWLAEQAAAQAETEAKADAEAAAETEVEASAEGETEISPQPAASQAEAQTEGTVPAAEEQTDTAPAQETEAAIPANDKHYWDWLLVRQDAKEQA